MSERTARAQLLVLRLILIVLVGAAATFGSVKFAQHNNDARACQDARVAAGYDGAARPSC